MTSRSVKSVPWHANAGESRPLGKRGHIRLLVIAALVWAAFWAGGLPHYYQLYSTRIMAFFDLAVLVPITGVACWFLRGVRPEGRLSVSAWSAFHFTAPLAIYDWLYCGILLGHGMQFVAQFWYLSVYYAIPWIILPGVALILDRRDAKRSRRADVA